MLYGFLYVAIKFTVLGSLFCNLFC